MSPKEVEKMCKDCIREPAKVSVEEAGLAALISKPDEKLLVSDIHNPYSHLPRLKNPLSAGYIDVGEVYAEACQDQLEQDAKTSRIYWKRSIANIIPHSKGK